MPSSEQQPEFFVDRNLGRHKVPQGLASAGFVVHTLASVYGSREETVTDVEWLTDAGAQHWIVLTKDDRIRWRKAEIEALAAARARVFCLTNANLRAEQQVAFFVTNKFRILQRARKPGPYIYGVYENTLRRVWPP